LISPPPGDKVFTVAWLSGQLKLKVGGKAYYALLDPTVATAAFRALGIARSNSGNNATRSLTRFDLAVSQSQQLVVVNSRLSLPNDGMNFDRVDMFGQPTIQTLTEKDLQATSWTACRGALKERYNMFACHRGKIIDRVTGLDIVE
jgi:hypothetical protein